MYFVQDAHSNWNWIYFVVLIVVREKYSNQTIKLLKNLMDLHESTEYFVHSDPVFRPTFVIPPLPYFLAEYPLAYYSFLFFSFLDGFLFSCEFVLGCYHHAVPGDKSS